MSEITPESKGTTNASLLIRGAIWIAIGALIAAALVCVVWVLVGDQDGIIGRAFLTILLLAGFAGIAILEAGLATKRPDWLALASMITWIVALIVGAIKIWMPEEPGVYIGGVERFFQLLLVVGILQLALLHVRLFTPAARRYVTTFTTVIYYSTIAILVLLVGMLVFFLTLPDTFEYGDIYWRIVVALAILAAVGTTLIPLLNALFAPKKQQAVAPAGYAPRGYASQGYAPQGGEPQAYAPQGYAPQGYATAPAAQQWPTYADGATPLPVMQDGSPDWNAYYTGFPTQQQPVHQQGYGQLPAVPAADAGAAPAGSHDASFHSPDAPINAAGEAVPPAGAPPAPDGIAGVSAPQATSTPPYAPMPAAPTAPTVPPVPPMPDAAPSIPVAPDQPEQTAPAPGAFPPPPPAAPQR